MTIKTHINAALLQENVQTKEVRPGAVRCMFQAHHVYRKYACMIFVTEHILHISYPVDIHSHCAHTVPPLTVQRLGEAGELLMCAVASWHSVS